jgi:S-formylglutathione hydrolase FrmB
VRRVPTPILVTAAAGLVIGALAVVQAALATRTQREGAPAPPVAGFTKVTSGPSGGTIWRGRIPNSYARWDRRLGAIYVPPAYDAAGAYPVVYLLHGFPGTPNGFIDSLRLAQVADGLISSGRTQPFVAVMPIAGRVRGNPADDEWAGVWESYLVHDVVPWAEGHLAVATSQAGRAIAGLSGGGFGAVDVALRHPTMFGVVESWGGYFRPMPDGPFRRASAAVLAAHNPTLLVRHEAATLRRRRVRFYLATGFNHGGVFRSWTFAFARELRGLRIPVHVWASKRPDGGRYLRLQLPQALQYAFAD